METRVILKQEGDKPIIFCPDIPARYGKIVACVPGEGHSEVPLAYYRKLKPYEGKNADQRLAYYANYGGKYSPVRRVYRINAK